MRAITPAGALALVVALSQTLLVACAGDPDYVVQPGVIEFYDEQGPIVVPSTASVGSTFTVEVTTFGGGCESFVNTAVAHVADGAIVTPYDRSHIPGENEACTDILHTFHHEAALSFDTAGSKIVRFHGRRHRGNVDEDILLPYTIVVNE
ncbi:MAG TPA: hypothetical protein VFV99_28515 [Kofleriaceae bacterium]|nr:hypothetical protein [Kofleriaceae bacterium]